MGQKENSNFRETQVHGGKKSLKFWLPPNIAFNNIYPKGKNLPETFCSAGKTLSEF